MTPEAEAGRMNPFLDKSQADLKAMVQNGDLSDPELDALCARVCDGWDKPEYIESRRFRMFNPPTNKHEEMVCPRYTSDGREAMRLLVKYRLGSHWGRVQGCSDKEFLRVQKSINSDSPDVILLMPDAPDSDLLKLICCAITKAAVIVALTKAIEGDGE